MRKIDQNFRAALDFLYTQLPMFQRVGKTAFKKDLTNIRKLCKALGNPHKSLKAIHIAGTNGKGSTAHLIASIFQAKGYKTGVYTSPHYKDFRERIKINGTLCTKSFVIDFVQKNRAVFASIQPSFFEITVAMAFEYFRKERVDIAIIETGLGGRLDSTNVIRPVLSVITNISFDHQQFLGNTLPLIAKEKAGIIKKNVPVVIGEEQKEVKFVFKTVAEKKNAPISFASRTFRLNLLKEDLEYSYYDVYKNEKLHFKKLKVNLHGTFQHKNIATTLKTLDALPPTFSFSEKDIRKGLEQLKSLTYYLGRWQILAQKPLTICDSAHNEAGLKMIKRSLDKISREKLHFIFGTVNDKDTDMMLSLLPKDARYYFAKADIPRGLDAKVLMVKAKTKGLKGRAYTSVANALKAARRAASENDLIFVGGSIFVVAEVL